jgi:hypothetical protein
MESGKELYNDLVLAYNAGAKYVVVFDYPKISTYGILEEEHLEALKKFWNHINHNPPTSDALTDRVAYVLPRDYGFGFRGSDDRIWGLWGPDQLSKKVWDDVNNLIDVYGSRLDIVYDDPDFNNAIKSRYEKLFFWNGTTT